RQEGVRRTAGPDRDGDGPAHSGAVLEHARRPLRARCTAHRKLRQDGGGVGPMTDEQIIAVTMPKWGLSMQLGKITGWVAAEGDVVSVGDDLADIETEKIAGTLEAADAGTLRRIIARVGEDVPVSATIALIAPPGVSDAALDAAVQEARAVIDAGVPAEAAGGPPVETAEIGGPRVSLPGDRRGRGRGPPRPRRRGGPAPPAL